MWKGDDKKTATTASQQQQQHEDLTAPRFGGTVTVHRISIQRTADRRRHPHTPHHTQQQQQQRRHTVPAGQPACQALTAAVPVSVESSSASALAGAVDVHHLHPEFGGRLELLLDRFPLTHGRGVSPHDAALQHLLQQYALRPRAKPLQLPQQIHLLLRIQRAGEVHLSGSGGGTWGDEGTANE